MKNHQTIFIGLCVFFFQLSTCIPLSLKAQQHSLRVVFYNTENFYDIYNDSLTRDDEFTPKGNKKWTYKKYHQKLNQIYKIIIGIGQDEAPAIIGLAEVENKYVLNQLIYKTPLNNFDYQYVHQESQDPRGVDVALLYRKSFLNVIQHQFIRIDLLNQQLKTRDILYVKGIISQTDTIHIFVNHWPSKAGGEISSEPKRNLVASILKQKIDSLLKQNRIANILIMGDFNDNPYNESLKETLHAKNDTLNSDTPCLINMMQAFIKKNNIGTNKYRSRWDIIDQMIISSVMLSKTNNVHTSLDDIHIYDASYLLVEDKTYLGTKPFRTYQGPKYLGGFSDHLPIYLDLFY